MNLPDIQKSTEGFKRIPIKKVGMRHLELPMRVFHTALRRTIEVKGTFSSYCNLVEDVKGINMSRISRTLIDALTSPEFDLSENLFARMETFSKELKRAHETDNIYTKVTFDYPLYPLSPVTELSSPEYVKLTLETNFEEGRIRNFLTISRVGMSLCPCSKEMSLLTNNLTPTERQVLETLPPELFQKVKMAGYGAHNQRSHIDLTVEVKDVISLNLEHLVNLLDQSFSCPVKTVLKRPDEKYETEVSYLGGFFNNNATFQKVNSGGPKFVEDIARDVAHSLNQYLDSTIIDYVVVVNNDESIHSGDILATAILTAGRDLQ